MPDSLDTIREQVRERMQELAPLIEEYRQLEGALAALEGGSSTPPPARRNGRSAGSGSGPTADGGTGGARRGRRKGSGTRANEALRLVDERPGITIPELAEAMGIKQNYLYRVMPTLAGEGKVVKSGRGWHSKKD
jgi:hypothetical protein